MSMYPHEIGKSYDALAESWQTRPSPTNGIRQFERALRFVKTRGHALDIGCGSNPRLLDLINKQGFQVEAIDISEKMITLARQQRPQVTFHHADICTWTLPRQYDLISGWDSIWHVPLADQEALMRKICDGLAPNGVFIFTNGGVDDPTEKTDDAMGVPVSFGAPGIPLLLEYLARFGCICRHLEYDQYPELHLVIIAQKRG